MMVFYCLIYCLFASFVVDKAAEGENEWRLSCENSLDQVNGARQVRLRTRPCSGRWGETKYSRISSFQAETRFRSEAQCVGKVKFEVERDDGESLAAFSPFSKIFVV